MGNQGAKKTATQPPAPVKSQEVVQKQKAIKVQKTTLNIDRQIKMLEDKQKKNQVQIDQYKAKAKQYLELNKKVDAKKYLEQAARMQKQSATFSTKRRLLENQKFQLDEVNSNKQVVQALGEAQEHLKEQQRINQKLQDIIMNSNETKMIQQQLNDKMKELAEDQELDEDVDSMMAQLTKQVNAGRKDKIPQKQVQPNVNVNMQKQKKQQNEDDEISKMMAEL